MSLEAPEPEASSPPDELVENRIIGVTTRRPVGVSMVALAVFVFGVVSLQLLPVELMPDIAQPRVTVRTAYPGAAPDDVEDRVSRRLEEALSVVRGLRRIESISRAESSDVVLELGWDADLGEVVQDVRERIDQTQLPDDVDAPTILRYDPTLEPVLRFSLTGDVGLTRLRQVAEDEVERRLESTTGVAAVKVRGGLDREIRIAVDEEKARARRIDLALISRRLAEENLDQASGLIEEGDVTYLVRTRNEFRSLQEIRDVPLRRDGASTVRLADVARVIETNQDVEVVTRVDGKPSVEIEIFREADANLVDVARRVRNRVLGTPEEQEQFERWSAGTKESLTLVNGDEAGTDDEDSSDSEERSGWGAPKSGPALRPSYIAAQLPTGIDLELLADRSTFIEDSITDLLATGVVGGLLAIFVLFLFLGRFSFTAVVAVSIPFSVVATFAPMYAGDVSLNVMSLGGLALGIGMLVDSSIVVLESIFRQRESGLGAVRAAIVGASDVGGAVFASTLTTIAVFFPIIFVEGVAGRLFRDQATTVVLSLIASLVVALTLIPALAARLTTDGSGRPTSPGIKRGFGLAGRRFERRRHGPKPVGLVGRARAVVRSVFAIGLLVCDFLYAVASAVLYGILSLVRFLAAYVSLVVTFFSGFVIRAFDRGYRRIENAYTSLLGRALRHRVVVGLVAVAAVAVAFQVASGIGTELIPQVAQGELDVRVRYPVGTPIETTSERLLEFEGRIEASESVDRVATRIGVDPDDVEESDEGENTGRFRVTVMPGDGSVADREARAIRDIESVLRNAPDLAYEIERPEILAIRSPVEVEIYGTDIDKLFEITREVEAKLAALDSLFGVRSTLAPGSPEYHIVPDRETLMRNGLTSEALSSTLRTMNLGEVASRFRDVEDRIDIRVRLDEEDRSTIDELLDARVIGSGSRSFRIRDLIREFRVRSGPSEIRRIGQRRAAIVRADTRGLDLASATEEIEAALAPIVADLPPDFRIGLGGQVEESKKSLRSMALALLLAVFLVYVVMASQFESLVQPFVILFTIPLASIGVVFALDWTGTPMSIPAAIGLVVLAGIVVNNAIVLLDQINRLRVGRSTDEAIIEGGRRRLRPILMTTATTVLAMVPLTGLLTGLDLPGIGGEGVELRAPMAITVIGGLLSSTLLTLVVIPVVYRTVSGGNAPEDRDADAADSNAAEPITGEPITGEPRSGLV